MAQGVADERICCRYGQTNCFVGVGITYGLYEAADGESLYLITHRSARNMAFQDLLLKRGEISKVAEVKGADLVGTRITAPASVYGEVYVLPMDGVSATKVSTAISYDPCCACIAGKRCGQTLSEMSCYRLVP